MAQQHLRYPRGAWKGNRGSSWCMTAAHLPQLLFHNSDPCGCQTVLLARFLVNCTQESLLTYRKVSYPVCDCVPSLLCSWEKLSWEHPTSLAPIVIDKCNLPLGFVAKIGCSARVTQNLAGSDKAGSSMFSSRRHMVPNHDSLP